VGSEMCIRDRHFLELALAMRRGQKPVDPVAMTAVLNNLALVRLHQGRQPEAAVLGRENLELRREFWGENHLEVAVGYSNLGFILNADESYPVSELIDLHARGLELRLQHLGPSHPDVAVSYNNLASATMWAGDLAKTEEYLRLALEIWRQFLGEHHKDVLIGELNLINIRRRRGETETAKSDLEQVVERTGIHLGKDHPIYAHGLIMVTELEEDLACMDYYDSASRP